MDKSLLNGSGCLDLVAHEAINNAECCRKGKVRNRDEAAETLIKTIKYIFWLSGFKLIDRIQFEDPKTGKKYL